MRRKVIIPENITVHTGKTEYTVDLPDGDCQIRYEIKSDKSVSMFLVAGKKLIPFSNGDHITGTTNVARCNGILIKAPKTAQVAFEIYHEQRTALDPINQKPVEVPIPEPVSVPLAELVGRVVADKLAEAGHGDRIDIEELIEDYPDDIDEEFGNGYMEMDDDMENRVADLSDNSVQPSEGDNPTGDTPDTSVVNTGDEQSEPGSGEVATGEAATVKEG